AAVRRAQSRAQLASRGSATPVNRAAAGDIVAQYRNAILYFNHRLSAAQADRIARGIISFSNQHPNLDARLVMAVIAVESNFNPNAVSRVGAQGLGQLMPGTAAGLGVRDAFNPEDNIEGSARLLSGHLAQMSAKNGRYTPSVDDVKLALACYNAGSGAVKKYHGVPPYRETQNYVRKVTHLYFQLCGYPD